jgi:hypothetical protein
LPAISAARRSDMPSCLSKGINTWREPLLVIATPAVWLLIGQFSRQGVKLLRHPPIAIGLASTAAASTFHHSLADAG